ncbi:trace amine-associated receptor 6-like [Lethenteron reissneri]|uniref:trace amine-associated receptor 6-like n=1 Tax=Lethenteron reissneri TaxID=7753 RepID=UPI002AB79632|nr:trace amine-associated receptor 6-like [Lethenteron reissneri]
MELVHKQVFTALAVCTCLFVVASNFLYLLLLAEYRHLRAHTNAFMLHLAACDLALGLVGLIGLPLASAHQAGLLGDEACRAATFVLVQLQVMAVHSITWLSIGRFLEIRLSLTHTQVLTPARSGLALAAVWTYAALIAGLPFAGLGRYGYNANAGMCTPLFEDGGARASDSPYSGVRRSNGEGGGLPFVRQEGSGAYCSLALGGGVAAPIAVLCGMYAYVVHAACKQAKRGTFVCDEENCRYVPANRYLKCTVMLITAVATLLTCWLPHMTISFYISFTGKPAPWTAQAIASWMLSLPSALNPWANSLSQRKFRKAMTQRWKRWPCCARDSSGERAERDKGGHGEPSPQPSAGQHSLPTTVE